MPFLNKLNVGLGQVIDELVVEVYDIINHIVSYYRFLCGDKFTDYLREAHLDLVKIVDFRRHEFRLLSLLLFLGNSQLWHLLGDIFLFGFALLLLGWILWVLSLGLLCRCLRRWLRCLATLDPPLDDEDVAIFLELSEEIRAILELDGDLLCELALESLRLNSQLSLLIFCWFVRLLHPLLYRLHILNEQFWAWVPHVREEAWVWSGVLTWRDTELLIDLLDTSLFNFITFCQLLKGNTLRKEFVEIEVIISQEFETTRLKLS